MPGKVSNKMLLRLSLVALLLLQLGWSAHAQDEETIEVEEGTEEAEQPEEVKPLYSPPTATGETFFTDHFTSEESFKQKWVLSEAKKEGVAEDIAKYDGKWAVEEPEEQAMSGDLGLVLKSRAKHHAVAAKLDKPFKFDGKPLVVQYEVRFQKGMECGGAYIKLLSDVPGLDLKNFQDKTGYTIMFGPDKCGVDTKLHFIFRHKNPNNGTYEEKHAKKPTMDLVNVFTDKQTHLFTLIVNPDNSFELLVDQTLVNSGSLLHDVSPPVNPPQEIEDPDDSKPEDWDEREKIPDPDATKPEDWNEDAPRKIVDPDATKPSGWLDDEEEFVPDPNAVKPEDWDDEMDGEWEAPQIENPKCEAAPGCGEWSPPMIDNPEYKGKWKAPMIANPNYKGIWKPRMIPNPEYFEDLSPYAMTPIGAIGLELWSMTEDVLFDNFIITNEKTVADDWAKASWKLKSHEEAREKAAQSFIESVVFAAYERPWLWVVYIMVVAIPVILFIHFCCPATMPKKKAAHPKKTDAISPDDKVPKKKADLNAKPAELGQGDAMAEEDQEEAAADEEAEGEAVEEEEEAEEKGEEQEAPEEDQEERKPSKADLEATEQPEALAEEGSPRTSARKRKVRKD
ncbi:calnexin-like isoform X1 [Branchiostoma floridae x Branchiostoma belcheri]